VNSLNRDALVTASLCIGLNGALGVGVALLFDPKQTLGGMQSGLGLGLALAPVMVLSLVDRRPLFLTPIIVGAAWTSRGLVMLGSTNSHLAGMLVLFATAAFGCLFAVTLIRRDSESMPMSACTQCGYDLFAIDEGACPECGRQWKASDIPRRPSDRVPWSLGDFERWALGLCGSALLAALWQLFSLL
jgi:hypothetical protein